MAANWPVLICRISRTLSLPNHHLRISSTRTNTGQGNTSTETSTSRTQKPSVRPQYSADAEQETEEQMQDKTRERGLATGSQTAYDPYKWKPNSSDRIWLVLTGCYSRPSAVPEEDSHEMQKKVVKWRMYVTRLFPLVAFSLGSIYWILCVADYTWLYQRHDVELQLKEGDKRRERDEQMKSQKAERAPRLTRD